MTVDFDTLEDDAVTIRERDTMKQERVVAVPGAVLLRRAAARLLTRPGPAHGRRRRAVQNVRVRSPFSRPALSLLALTTAGRPRAGRLQLGLGGDRGAQADSSSVGSSRRRVAVPVVDGQAVPDGAELTDQGSKLSFGDTGDGDLRVDAGPGDGAAADGEERPAGQPGRLQGLHPRRRLQAEGVLLLRERPGEERRRGRRRAESGSRCGASTPRTRCCRRSTSPPASSPARRKPLPAKFAPRRHLSTCLVYLSPDKGALRR